MSKSSPAAARWQALIQEQEASGLTVERFCRERGTTSSSFFRWRQLLRQEAAVSTPLPTAFVEARVADDTAGEDITPSPAVPAPTSPAVLSAPAAVSIELVLPGDLRLVIHPGFCRPLLLELIQTLQQLSVRSVEQRS
jgi:hypothetical protein